MATGPVGHGVGGGGLRPARWDEVAPRMRAALGPRAKARGGSWEQEEPRYRFGWEMTNEPRNQGRSFEESEAELRRVWGRSNPETPWSEAREAVRDAWETARGA